MISHTIITIPAVLLGLALHWWLGAPAPYTAAVAMTGLWFSREQYWDELKLRRVGRDSWRDVLVTMAMVFRPMQRNMDFFAPVAVAWAMTAVYIVGGAL